MAKPGFSYISFSLLHVCSYFVTIVYIFLCMLVAVRFVSITRQVIGKEYQVFAAVKSN